MKPALLRLVLLLPLLLAACIGVAPDAAAPPPRGDASALPPFAGAQGFADVVARVEPVAEAECRRLRPGQNCDFRIIVDSRPDLPPNAYQTLDDTGRPIIGFTQGLIRAARNTDELAFVMGHEAAHHIAGHIPRAQANAAAGAVVFAGLAVLTGGDASAVRSAQEIGAAVGARAYSKDFELEADALGTVITARAGFDPVRGAEFFNRIPDPGDRFLGTHPPNAERIAIVRRTAAGL